MPRRADAAFHKSYPIEQYHQENFANLYLNTLGVAAGLPDHIDWTFGPVGFRASAATHWLQFEGEVRATHARTHTHTHTHAHAHAHARTHTHTHTHKRTHQTMNESKRKFEPKIFESDRNVKQNRNGP